MKPLMDYLEKFDPQVQGKYGFDSKYMRLSQYALFSDFLTKFFDRYTQLYKNASD